MSTAAETLRDLQGHLIRLEKSGAFAFCFLLWQISKIKRRKTYITQSKRNENGIGGFLETDHKKLLRPNEVSKILGISTETVYDWKYRTKKRGIPEGLFAKISSMLFVRSDLLKYCISRQ